jgi:zinc transporter, ZIP family
LHESQNHVVINLQHNIFESLVWGFIASIPLVIGCIVPLIESLPKGIIAAIMAFGSGVLVAALTFSLVEEAFNLSQSIPPAVIGFILGEYHIV